MPPAEKRNWRLAAIGYTIAFVILMLLPLSWRVPSDLWGTLASGLLEINTSWVELGRAVTHLVLFVPIGLAVGLGREHLGRAIAVALIIALPIAVTSELAQLVVGRLVSVFDVVIDLLGATVGATLGIAYARSTRLHKLIAKTAPIAALVTLACVVAGALWLVVPAAPSWSTWDGSMPLVIGNEASGDRPWRGELHDITVLDRVADGPITTGATAALRYSFEPSELRAPAGHVSTVESSHAPVLFAGSGRVTALPEGGLLLDDPTMLTTVAPASDLVARLVASRKLALTVRLRCLDASATGPARIVGLSRDVQNRDFTLGQEGTSLHLRVRNTLAGPNGAWPELVVEDAVIVGAMQTITARCTPGVSVLEIDGVERGRLVYRRLHRLGHDLWSAPPHPRLAAGLITVLWLATWGLVVIALPATTGPNRRMTIAGVIAALLTLAVLLVAQAG